MNIDLKQIERLEWARAKMANGMISYLGVLDYTDRRKTKKFFFSLRGLQSFWRASAVALGAKVPDSWSGIGLAQSNRSDYWGVSITAPAIFLWKYRHTRREWRALLPQSISGRRALRHLHVPQWAVELILAPSAAKKNCDASPSSSSSLA